MTVPIPGTSEHPTEADTSPVGALRLLSYNLWENRAVPELGDLISRHAPDVVTVQEAFVDSLPIRVGRLQLVAATTANTLGLGLYADTTRFDVIAKGNYRLSPSRHDWMKGTVNERVTAARLCDRRTREEIIVGSVHTAPLTDSNRLRRKQITEAHDAVGRLGHDIPTLLAGDYNYPYFARGLIRNLDRLGLGVARSATGTYHKRGFVRGVFDLATVEGLTVDAVHTLPQGASDHHPILVTVHPTPSDT
jgi:endonuclease/exonuclease/phosphatase (EEP) superfamily protein YafD